MALRLHNTRILNDDVQALTFILEEFSDVGESVFSKQFTFSGHRWRLQSGAKGGYLGVFLRWVGGGVQNRKMKCKIRVEVDVLNFADPSMSTTVGNLDEDDEFPRSGFGIGWSKVMPVETIEKPNSGFLDDNCLLLQVKCKFVQTTFEDKMVVNLVPGTDFTTSSKFSLFDSEWSIVMYPRGENPENSTPQKDHTAIYLRSENTGLLRFDATFSLYIPKVKEMKITHHFHEGNPSKTFGVEKFIRTRDLRSIAKGGTIPVGVKITSMKPYFYLGFDTKEWSPPENLGTSLTFSDIKHCPLSFKAESVDQKKLDFKLQFDPENRFPELGDSAYSMKILWSVMVFCYKDDNKSTTLNSWDTPGCSAFCFSNEEITMSSPLLLSEAISPYSPFLDEEKLLSVKLIIHNANEVYDPLMIEDDKHSIAKLREVNAQTRSTTEKYWIDQLSSVCSEKDQIIADQNEIISAREKELNDKESAIHTLEEDIEEKQNYITSVEDNIDGTGEVPGKKHVNLKELIEKTHPDAKELEKQKQVAEQLEDFLMNNLPFNVSRISVVGNAGQGTTSQGVKEVDLAIFIKDLPRTEHKSWLPAIVFTTKTLLKQHCQYGENDDHPKLPPCSDFLETSSAVVFKCDDVNVVLIPTNDWEPFDSFNGLYQMCLTQTEEAQPYYILSACERQTEFIAKQPDKCKDLIRAVRAWCNSIPWKNTESKPGQYLLSLLVVAAYQIVQSGYISQTVAGDKEVFLEFAEMVNDVNLEVFWNEFYLSSSYPRESFPVSFELPIVQDPAVPTHNVASTGLEDWSQFRKEVVNWVERM